MAQCAAKTKEGTACQIPAREGQKYCHIHRRQSLWRWIFSGLGIGALVFSLLSLFADLTGLLSYFGIQPSIQHPVFTSTANIVTQQQPFRAFDTQIVVSSGIKPTVYPTKTLHPTPTPLATITSAPSYTPSPVLPTVSQPTRSIPSTATRIPFTRTNILPSDTPLPPTEMPIVIPTNTPLLSFNSLPSAQGWKYKTDFTYIPESWIFSVDGSQLHMDTMSQGGSGYAYMLNTPIDRQLPFTLDVKARVTNYGDDTNNNPWGFTISVRIGFEQFAIGIRPNRIVGGTATDLMPLNPIDVNQFHNYRIEGQAGQDFNVFVDGNLLGTVSSETMQIEQYALYFGDTTAGANAQADIVSYSFTQGFP